MRVQEEKGEENENDERRGAKRKSKRNTSS
jgi:hypothetical protein